MSFVVISVIIYFIRKSIHYRQFKMFEKYIFFNFYIVIMMLIRYVETKNEIRSFLILELSSFDQNEFLMTMGRVIFLNMCFCCQVD